MMLVVCLAALAVSLAALAGSASAAAEHRCALARDSGWCNQHTVQWYFDSEYGDCLQFWYSGCDGNDNRFDSERDCAATCRTPRHWRHVCQLPPVPGPCQQRQTAWHYDAARAACVAFVYSGCLGNNNRFTTRLQCESECGQLRRYRLTMNETAYADTSHYHDHTANDPDHDLDAEHVDYYDSDDGYAMTRRGAADGSVDDTDETTGQRQADTSPATTTTTATAAAAAAATKITTPAAATAQPSVTVTHAADASVCHLADRQPGDCDNYIVRYSHVHHYRQCAPFYYSGCGGNGNNFASLAQCQHTCITATATATAAATATPTAGHASDTNVHTHRDDSHTQMDLDLQSQQQQQPQQQQQQQQQQQPQQQQQQHGDSNSWLGVLRQSFFSYDSDSQTQQQANSGGGGSGGGDGDLELSDFDHESRQQLQQQQQQQQPLQAIREEQPAERGLAEEEQQQLDGGQLPQLCWLDKDGGPCFDYLYRYFYDRQLRACRQFIYSGCHGNANRFHTLADCERHCLHPATATPATTPATGGASVGHEHSPPDYQYGDTEYYGESAAKDYDYY